MDPFFHQCGRDGKVYLISNVTRHSGVDIAVEMFQEHIVQQNSQKNVARTMNDGLRIGCVLLDPRCRDTVVGMMTNKKTRKKSDITGDPDLHFYEKILKECYLNPLCEAMPPKDEYFSVFPEDEKSNWDPNHPAIQD